MGNRGIRMRENRYSGALIVFEGVDGSGKTTMLSRARDYLEELGHDCTVVKMPSPRIRNLVEFKEFHYSHNTERRQRVSPFAMTVLASGDRLVVLETEVIPSLSSGKWVLCDRYVYTGLAVCDDPPIRQICETFIQPSLVFFADAAAETVKLRVLEREDEKHRFYNDDFVENQMRRFYTMATDNDFVVVDTNGAAEDAHRVVERHIQRLLDARQ